MKKGIILGLGVFLSLILSLIISLAFVSALGTEYICLNKGEKLFYSDCNPDMDDYTCTVTTCNLCVNEIRTGVYCPDNGCTGVCTYLYDEPEPPAIDPPVEDPTNVVLISPENNYFLENPAQVTFSFKAIKKTQKARFSICELVIDGKSVSSKSSPQWNMAYSLKSSLKNGIHTWGVYCTEAESDGGGVIMSEQRTITIGNTPGTVCGNGVLESGEECDDGNTANNDGCSSVCKIEEEQQTEISLTSPANGYSSTDTQTLDFKFDISSSILSKIISCNLILNNENVKNITSVSGQNTISYSVSPNSYTWRIDCLDNHHPSQTTSSISRTFTINSPAPANTGGNPGGGGGGGGGGGSSAITYTLNQEQLSNGTTQSLQKSARFKFKISNEDHYVIVDEVTTTYVQLTVSSEPQKFLLYIADEKRVDINNDKIYDISLILNKIENNKASITIKSISESVPESETSEVNQEATENTEASTAQTSQNKLSGITGAVIGGIKSNKIPVAIGFIIIIAIVAIISYNYKANKKAE